jgi:YHS domain-containing protein
MHRLIPICGILLAFVAFLLGCGSADSAKTTATKSANSQSTNATPAKESSATTDVAAEDADIRKAMAQLSPEDRSLAMKQKVCPVSGEKLGSMGAPVKLDVKGQAVFICCEGCKDELLAQPDKYLAKIGK